jgi:hypothetical protein
MSDVDAANSGRTNDEPADDRPDGADRRSVVTRLRRWMGRLGPLGRWSAGVAAGVVTALLTAWLINWGLLPGRPGPPGQGLPFTYAVSPAWEPGAGWISDRPVVELPPRPIGSEAGPDGDKAVAQRWEEFVRRGGAVQTEGWGVQFTVQGRSSAQVTLTDLDVRVVARRPPVRGTMFLEEGGDPTEFRRLNADLDDRPVTLSSVYLEDWEFGTIPRHERRPIEFPYRVSLSDAETFIVRAYTDGCDCSWIIELSWTSEGRNGRLTIDDSGVPFRTTSTANVTHRCGWMFAQSETCRPVQ